MVRSTALSIAVATLWWSGSANAATIQNWEEVQPPNIPGLVLKDPNDPNSVNPDIRFFGWDNLTSNNSSLNPYPYLDFGLVMYEADSQVRFAFLNWLAYDLSNNGAEIPSSITDIYFDDSGAQGLLGGVEFVADSGDPNFISGADNPDLPGKPAGWVTDQSLSAQSSNPPPHRGVEAMPEWIVLGYDYVGSNTDFSDILAAIDAGNIRIAMHVQGINGSDGSSDSFIWTPLDPGESPGGPGPLDPGTPVVPVPAAAGLGFLGMALLAVVRRKKS
jgi:hypothetical protein